jgi:plastocyanin
MCISRTWLLAALAGAAVGCSSSSSTPTSPTSPGTGGGPVGSVIVGDIFFQSGHNGTQNPAQDTVAVGQMVTWTWTNTGSTSHSVQSISSPSFTSSNVLTGNGQTYAFTFTQPGTYHYQCAVHGSLMTGVVVVQ